MTRSINGLNWQDQSDPSAPLAPISVDFAADPNWIFSNMLGSYQQQAIYPTGVIIDNSQNNALITVMVGSYAGSVQPFQKNAVEFSNRSQIFSLSCNSPVQVELEFYVKTPAPGTLGVNFAGATDVGGLPTTQVFITPGVLIPYTPTVGTKWIRVKMVAGGGGGGGCGAGAPTNGGDGDPTTFNNFQAQPGKGGGFGNGGSPNAGGQGGSSPVDTALRFPGAAGNTSIGTAGTADSGNAGDGGSNPFGGRGATTVGNGTGGPGQKNTGAGAAGATGLKGTTFGGAGGGAGEYVEIVMLAAPGQLAVGKGGNPGAGAGAGAALGGRGADGIVIVEEYSSF